MTAHKSGGKGGRTLTPASSSPLLSSLSLILSPPFLSPSFPYLLIRFPSSSPLPPSLLLSPISSSSPFPPHPSVGSTLRFRWACIALEDTAFHIHQFYAVSSPSPSFSLFRHPFLSLYPASLKPLFLDRRMRRIIDTYYG